MCKNKHCIVNFSQLHDRKIRTSHTLRNTPHELQTGMVNRQHFLKQYPGRFAMTDMNIALIADNFSQNVHFIHFLKYHGIKLDQFS